MLKFERHIFCLRINPIATSAESKPGLQVKSIIDARGSFSSSLAVKVAKATMGSGIVVGVRSTPRCPCDG